LSNQKKAKVARPKKETAPEEAIPSISPRTPKNRPQKEPKFPCFISRRHSKTARPRVHAELVKQIYQRIPLLRSFHLDTGLVK
jgi:hypothetical protein